MNELFGTYRVRYLDSMYMVLVLGNKRKQKIPVLFGLFAVCDDF